MSHFAKCTKENDLIWSIVPQLNTNEFLHNTLPLCSLGGLIFFFAFCCYLELSETFIRTGIEGE